MKQKELSLLGVSEVVGAVLILLITIAMFSVVIAYVISYPTPTERIHADFRATLEGQYVNITHRGGETLKENNAWICVEIDGTSRTYTLSDGGVGKEFSVGETWSILNTSIVPSSSVRVYVVAEAARIYDEQLGRIAGNNAPIIAFAVAKPSTIPADASTGFVIQAYVIDPDNDVTACMVNLSAVGRGLVSLTGTGNVFQTSTLTIPTSTSVRKYTCLINATDSNGNTGSGYVSFSVTSPSVLEGGGFWRSSSGEGDQGFMITNALDSTQDMRIFNQTDTIWVKVASTVLRNLVKRNTFVLKDSAGTTLTPPTSIAAFNYYDHTGGYYFYAYSFDVQDISGLTDNGGVYYAHIELKDYADHVFMTDATIIIKDIYGNIPGYGIIKTYSDSACTVECTRFDSTGVIYLKIFTITTGSASSAIVGDVEIRDFVGSTQVKKTPGNSPVSEVTIVSGNYSLSINLSNANQDPWLYPGPNAYTLSIRTFQDADEYYESIATQLIIVAPTILLDIIAGIDELTNPAWGTKDYLYLYDNDNLWSKTVVDNIKVAPKKYTYRAALGDIDGDTDLDIVASVAAGSPLKYYLYLYRNLGDNWAGDTVNYRTTIDDTETGTLGGRVNTIALGDLDGDGDLEIVVGTDANEVVYYRNDGNWTRRVVSTGKTVYWVALGYMEGSADTDLDIVVGSDGGKIVLFLNNGYGTLWSEISVTGGTGVGGTAIPISKDANDTTGENIVDAQTDDDAYYNVTSDEGGATLWFNSFDTAGMSGTPAAVTLKIQYKTDSGYNGTSYLQFNNSGSWVDAIQILNSTVEVNATYDLKSAGVDTLSEIANLDVRFHNNDGSGNTTICRANKTDPMDTANTNLTNIADYDLLYSTVRPGEELWLDGFDNTTNLTEPFTQVSLVVVYRTGRGYNDNKYFWVSTTEGTIWIQTSIQITNTGGAWVTATDATLASRISTINDVRNLDVYFTHSGNRDVDINAIYLIVKYVEPKIVSFDYIVIEVTPTGGVGGGTANIYCLAIGDMDLDGDNDIVSGDAGGGVWLSTNTGNGLTWSTPTTPNVLNWPGHEMSALDLGDMYGEDNKLDIAVGTDTGYVLEIMRMPDNSWRTYGVDTVGSAVNTLRVGDVDGDGDDDVVIGSAGGYIYYYDNTDPLIGSWSRSEVDYVGVVVYAVDLGDVSG